MCTTNYTMGVCLSLRAAELGVEPSDVTSWLDDVTSDVASAPPSLTSKLHRFTFWALPACGHSLTSARCGSGVIALSGSGTGMGQYRPAGPLTHRPAGPLDLAVAAPVRRQAEPLKSQPASGGNADTRIHHPAPQRRKSGSHRAWYKRRYSGSTPEAIPKGSTIRYPVLSDILCGTPLRSI